VLYRWPVYGWDRGTVANRSRTAEFSHVVHYGRASAIESAAAPSLLVTRLGRGLARPGPAPRPPARVYGCSSVASRTSLASL
jgi:hypothetical protein